MDLVKHWIFVWGLYWVFWGGIAMMETALVQSDYDVYIIPLIIFIIGIGSLYYGREWYK